MSRKLLVKLTLLAVSIISNPVLAAEPTDIHHAITKFQSFFTTRYPTMFSEVRIDDKNSVGTPELEVKFNKGQHFFWSRRGQLNYSCASCHVDNVGKRIDDEIIPPALGLGVNYSSKLSTNSQPSLHTQYQVCNKRTRARPFALQSQEYNALEYYLVAVSDGVKL